MMKGRRGGLLFAIILLNLHPPFFRIELFSSSLVFVPVFVGSYTRFLGAYWWRVAGSALVHLEGLLWLLARVGGRWDGICTLSVR
jgi:hypothetical protein